MGHDSIVVIQLHKLGDNLQITPLLRGLRERYPNAQITVITEKGFEGVFKDNRDITDIISFDRSQVPRRAMTDPAQFIKHVNVTLSRYHRHPPDLVINRQSNVEGAWLARAIGGQKTIGFQWTPDKGYFIADRWTKVLFSIPKHRGVNPFNLVDYNLYIGEAFPKERRLAVAYSHTVGHRLLSRLGVSKTPYTVACQPGCGRAIRQWRPEDFAQLANLILADTDVSVLCLGSAEDIHLIEGIIAQVDSSRKTRITNLAGHVPLDELPSILSICDLMISNDSGPMHFAAAVDCPVIGLFFGQYYHSAPYTSNGYIIYADLECLPCFDPTACPNDYACRQAIRPASVYHLYRHIRHGAPIEISQFKGIHVYTSRNRSLHSDIDYLPITKINIPLNEFSREVYRVYLKHLIMQTPIDIDSLTEKLRTSYHTSLIETFDGIDEGLLIDLFHNDPPGLEHARRTVREIVHAIQKRLRSHRV